MHGLSVWVKSYAASHATVRGVAASAILAVLLALAVRYVVIPPYQQAIGFIPFDAQARLSQVMVGIELAAFKRGATPGIYVLFAVADVLSALATAWAFTLAWLWLFTKVPNRIFAFLTRGGILMLPFYVLLINIVTKFGFFRLVRGVDGDASAAIDFAVTANRLAFALTDVRNYLTAVFLLAAATGLILRRVR